MSRYCVKANGQSFVYGFDNPLSQYFLDKGKEHLLGPLSKNYGDAVEIYGQMKKENIWHLIPQEHREAILGDETF